MNLSAHPIRHVVKDAWKISVIDQAGVLKAVLVSDGTGPRAVQNSSFKAQAALAFKESSGRLAEQVKAHKELGDKVAAGAAGIAALDRAPSRTDRAVRQSFSRPASSQLRRPFPGRRFFCRVGPGDADLPRAGRRDCTGGEMDRDASAAATWGTSRLEKTTALWHEGARAGTSAMRRRGREAEGDGLLNRYRGNSIVGSNPTVSATLRYSTRRLACLFPRRRG
jgi:Haem-degrading